MLYFLVGIAAAALIALIALSPRLVEATRIAKQAREDYTRCRGTHHSRQLDTAIKRHESSLRVLLSDRDDVDSKLARMDQQADRELRRTLARHLVETRLTDVPGIGAKLKGRIVQACFDGSLESLNRAYHVRGVGPEKAAAIRSWVYRMNQSMASMLQAEFPGKSEILDKQKAKRQKLTEKRADLDERTTSRKRVIDTAREGLDALADVKVSDFRKALRGDREASRRIAFYSLGAFAEWDRMPTWFAAILTEPGEE